MNVTTPSNDRRISPRGGRFSPNTIQRIEGALIAAAAMTATIVFDSGMWWFPLALFLVFDLSAAGYLRSASIGAFWYNAVHTFTWPAILTVIALVTEDASSSLSDWIMVIGLAWAFHIGVDRMLGYGLKLPDGFEHTHLGRIGKSRTQVRNG